MNTSMIIDRAFEIVLASSLHATLAGALAILAALALSCRSAALGHSLVMAGTLCLLALPLCVATMRNRTLWSIPLTTMSLGSVDTPATDPATALESFDDPRPNIPIANPTPVGDNRTIAREERLPSASTSSFQEELPVASIPADIASPGPAQSTRQTTSIVRSTPATMRPSPSLLSHSPPAPPSPIAWSSFLLSVWFVGSLFLGLRLASSIFYLHRVTQRAVPIPAGDAASAIASTERAFDVHSMRVLATQEIDRPLLWGWRTPTLLLPAGHGSWSKDDLELVLMHEFAHAARFDHRSRILLGTMKSLYWFHPVAWLLERLGGTLAEYAADDLSISRGQSPSSLADCLLRFASQRSSLAGISFASFRALRKRLERLAKCSNNPSRIGPRPRFLPTLLATSMAFLLALSVGFASPMNPTNASQSTPQRSVREVIVAMQSVPGWEHLPLDLEEQVANQFLSGPEFNVDVTLVDEQGDPVANALCAIVENEFERTNRQGYSRRMLQHEELPLALGVTDSSGKCLLRRIRGRQPSLTSNGIGIVGPRLVILHQEYGVRFKTLAKSNRIQRIELALEAGVNLSGDVATKEGEPIPNLSLHVVVCRGSISEAQRFKRADYLGSSILGPRITTQYDGSYVIAGLPPQGHCVCVFPDFQNPYFQLASPEPQHRYVPTTDLRNDIVVSRRTARKLVFRCIDSEGIDTPPIPSIDPQNFGSIEFDPETAWTTLTYAEIGDRAPIIALPLRMPIPWISYRYLCKTSDIEGPFEIPVSRGRIVRAKVIDSETHEPLSGIDVWAQPNQEDIHLTQPNWPKQGMIADGRTNREGIFEFAISKEAWSFYVDGPIHGYELPESMLGQGRNRTKEDPLGFTIMAGTHNEEVVIALQPAKKLRGRLLGSDEMPLPNTLITCSYMTPDRNEFVVTTNSSGEFELTLPPSDAATYQLEAQTEAGYGTLMVPHRWRTTGQTVELRLKRLKHSSRGRTIEGRVLLDGEGRANIKVAITRGMDPEVLRSWPFSYDDSPIEFVASSFTDENGDYRIDIPESENGAARFFCIPEAGDS